MPCLGRLFIEAWDGVTAFDLPFQRFAESIFLCVGLLAYPFLGMVSELA